MDLTSGAAVRQQRSATALALVLGGVAALTLAIVWGFQWAGYMPCELCLLQRNPFYVAVPLALLTAAASWRARRGLMLAGFALLAALFLVSAGLGAYHAGVEWQLWAGPTGCTGALAAPAQVGDFLKQLQTVKVVRCDAAALRIFGVSLAGWNVVVSLILCGVAGAGVRNLWRPRPGTLRDGSI